MESVTKFCNLCNGNLTLDKFHKGNGSFGVKSRCIVCCRQYKIDKHKRKQYYLNNFDKAREARRKHQRNNREDYRRRSAEYDRLHRAQKTARESFRRAQKLKATPPWLTKEHREQIEAFYIESRRLSDLTGIIHHVDHIVPLISKVVCGLHVPWNLQVIPAQENLKKSNKV